VAMRKSSGLGDRLHHPTIDAVATLIYCVVSCTRWLLRMLCLLRSAKQIYLGYPTTTHNNEAKQVDNQLLCRRAFLMSKLILATIQ